MSLEAIADVLRACQPLPAIIAGGQPRSGGALLPHLVLDCGLPEEEAITEAMRVGLRSAEYLESGLDYVARRRPTARAATSSLPPNRAATPVRWSP